MLSIFSWSEKLQSHTCVSRKKVKCFQESKMTHKMPFALRTCPLAHCNLLFVKISYFKNGTGGTFSVEFIERRCISYGLLAQPAHSLLTVYTHTPVSQQKAPYPFFKVQPGCPHAPSLSLSLVLSLLPTHSPTSISMFLPSPLLASI